MIGGHRTRGSAMHTEEGANTLCSGSTQLFKKTLSPRTNNYRVSFVGDEQDGKQERPASHLADRQSQRDRRCPGRGRALSQLGQLQPAKPRITETPCPSWDNRASARCGRAGDPELTDRQERRCEKAQPPGSRKRGHIPATGWISGPVAIPWNMQREIINRIKWLRFRWNIVRGTICSTRSKASLEPFS